MNNKFINRVALISAMRIYSPTFSLKTLPGSVYQKTPALTLSCLGLCTQNTLYKKCGHNRSLKLSLLLLLSGDVSLNPGPNISCNMGFATTNLRYVRQKSAALSDLISSKQIDILAMTEKLVIHQNS